MTSLSFKLLLALLYNLELVFVQKNYNGAQMVMSQMQIAGLKPDSETFSYLIANCESEENISKVCHIPDHLLLPLCLFYGVRGKAHVLVLDDCLS